MSPAERAAIVREIFWPSTGRLGWKVYALLDAARDPLVYPTVKSCGLPFACLYAGKLPEVMMQVAPYLLELRPWTTLTGDLLEERWGESWGVFVLSGASLEELRRHFRRMLKAQDENGKSLVFRFYDPRVLRTYLPTCTPAELAFVFGPVGMFVLEGADGGVLPFHRDAEGGLSLAPLPKPGG